MKRWTGAFVEMTLKLTVTIIALFAILIASCSTSNKSILYWYDKG